MNVLSELRRRFAAALALVAPDEQSIDQLATMVLPSQDARFGDYQANCAMPLGKKLGKSPRDVAAEIVAQLDVADLCDPPEVAGPGFINLRLRDPWLVEQLAATMRDDQRLGVPTAPQPRTIVLDFSSPNVAKPMHVGHIRSTVIGDSLARTLRFLGHRVITDNHIGDWGTQFGMIIYGYKHFADEPALAAAPVAEMSRLYKLVNALVEYHETRDSAIPALEARIAEAEKNLAELRRATEPTDPAERKKAAKKIQQAETQLIQLRTDLTSLRAKVAAIDDDAHLAKLAAAHANIGQAVLAETAALHAGDPVNHELWERFLPACLAEMEAVYRRLHVTFDHTLGESFYEYALPEVVKSLTACGLARHSEGALCIFLAGFDAPFIIQKRDGAFLYATTDLATIQYRKKEWNPDAMLYVVDHRQSMHFEQLFAAAKLWGYDDVEFQHIGFGTVLGDDGRPFKTRSGTSVGLNSLLDEAVERALAIVSENDDARPEPLLSADDRQTVAERIGIGAIKYADLAHNRTSDYKFSYDKMLAMTGNTAAYMQYSYARVRSIFDKGGVDPARLRLSGAPITLDHPAERALALALLQFSEALDGVVADYRPNHLTDYLFHVASKYAAFFENCPVLKAETEDLRTSRLLLCDLTARTLARGLDLLGIQVVERM